MTAIVTPTPIDDLPPAPLPTDTIPVFNSSAFALVAALEDFVDQTNASATATEQNATAANERAVLADASADAAALSEAAAVAAAASAINAPGTNANSTTSLALTAGAKAWTIQTGKLYPPGQPIYLASAANPTVNRMYGILGTHDNTTGACTATMTPDPGASGTHTDWIMGIGVSVATGSSLPRIARTSNTALTVAEKGKLIDVTSGTFTQTTDSAATLTADWYAYLTNTGTGVVTFGTLALVQGASVKLQSDGTTVRAYPERLPEQVLVAREEQAATTQGGTPGGTGTWLTRTLNTTPVNTIVGASRTGNEITLPGGTYRINASAPAYRADGHKARLYNVTGAAVLLVGSSEGCSSDATTPTQTRSHINGVFTLSTASAVRIEHVVGTATATSGFGRAGSGSAIEVFTEATFVRISA